MKKIYLLSAFIFVAYSLQAQHDTILKKSGVVTVCSIDSLTTEGIHFHIPNKVGYNYKLFFKDVSAYYYLGKWEIISMDSLPKPVKVTQIPVYHMPPEKAPRGPLEKAGRNLIISETVLLGGGLFGSLLLNSKSEGVKTGGVIVLAGSGITSLVYLISVGVNLIDAQEYVDRKSKGLTLGSQPNGVGIGWRF